ncbi:hypothetical protein Gotur_001990 [Gossypium turneri]
MNLNTMQEVTKVAMTQVVMEAVINASMLRGINHDHAKGHETWKQPHLLEAESLSETLFGIQNTIV